VNTVESLPLAGAIPPEVLEQARAEAAQSQRPLMEVLEKKLGLAPQAFAAALGATVHMRVVSMAELHRLKPDFDSLPLTEAIQKHCIAVRDSENSLLLVCGDPFLPHLSPWAEERIAEPFFWVLAHPADAAASRAGQEE